MFKNYNTNKIINTGNNRTQSPSCRQHSPAGHDLPDQSGSRGKRGGASQSMPDSCSDMVIHSHVSLSPVQHLLLKEIRDYPDTLGDSFYSFLHDFRHSVCSVHRR